MPPRRKGGPARAKAVVKKSQSRSPTPDKGRNLTDDQRKEIEIIKNEIAEGDRALECDMDMYIKLAEKYRKHCQDTLAAYKVKIGDEILDMNIDDALVKCGSSQSCKSSPVKKTASKKTGAFKAPPINCKTPFTAAPKTRGARCREVQPASAIRTTRAAMRQPPWAMAPAPTPAVHDTLAFGLDRRVEAKLTVGLGDGTLRELEWEEVAAIAQCDPNHPLAKWCQKPSSKK